MRPLMHPFLQAVRVAASDAARGKGRVSAMLALTRTREPAELQRVFDEY